MITVRVPATSANIGPGFDCLGVALTMYVTVTFSFITHSQQADGVVITGCEETYANKDNLIYQAFCRAMNHMNKPIPKVAIEIKSEIPVARGLGSSAACIVAGVLGANAWCDSFMSHDEVFALATQMEGHPDNIAPALYGGLCASMMKDGTPHVIRANIPEDISFTALIPDIQLTTSASRAVLPNMVALKDATYNISRSVFVFHALQAGTLDLLSLSIDDALHQPYRKTLIPDYEEIVNTLRSDKDAFYISGAGPTLIGISRSPEKYDQWMNQLNNSLSCQWSVIHLRVNGVGATVERSVA